jgi:hypothetical protein
VAPDSGRIDIDKSGGLKGSPVELSPVIDTYPGFTQKTAPTKLGYYCSTVLQVLHRARAHTNEPHLLAHLVCLVGARPKVIGT